MKGRKKIFVTTVDRIYKDIQIIFQNTKKIMKKKIIDCFISHLKVEKNLTVIFYLDTKLFQ